MGRREAAPCCISKQSTELIREKLQCDQTCNTRCSVGSFPFPFIPLWTQSDRADWSFCCQSCIRDIQPHWKTCLNKRMFLSIVRAFLACQYKPKGSLLVAFLGHVDLQYWNAKAHSGSSAWAWWYMSIFSPDAGRVETTPCTKCCTSFSCSASFFRRMGAWDRASARYKKVPGTCLMV